MRILVTGNEGFIGKNVASYLQQQGHEVEGWEWQPGILPSTEDYDWCIHLGAISSTTYTDVNQGLNILMYTAKEKNTKVIKQVRILNLHIKLKTTV